MDTKILNNNQDKTNNEYMDKSIRRYRLPIMIVFIFFNSLCISWRFLYPL